MRSARILLAAVTSVAVVSLSACGIGGSGDSGSQSTANDGPVTGDVTGTISFETWNLKAKYSDYFTGLIKQFEQQHPGAKVNWLDQPADGYADKLSADASADSLPDVINLSPDFAYPLYKKKLLLDLDKAAPDAAKDYLPNAWQGNVMPGQKDNYAFPWYLNTGPYFYNKKLFTDGGLDPNKPPTTYDELAQQGLTLAKNTNGAFAMLGQTPQIEDLGLYGVDLMDPAGTKFTFNSAKGVKLVELYKSMYDAKALLPEALSATYTGSGKKFLAQQVAISSGSAYDLQTFRTDAPSLYANVGITAPMTNTGHANMYVQGLSVAAHSKNKATAIAFGRFVTNAQNQMAFAKIVTVFPSTAGTLNDPFFTQDDGTDIGRVRVASAKQLANGINYTPVQLSDQMKTVLRNELANAMLGKSTPQQALDNAVNQCNQLLGH
ncbi:extracellular solute-binding protein [Solihabitans fulvus]|uniref:Extracellular solute-binding protein n=1 Tax=Solihabitans fulvus TaxID=1892852 RepID=A0A5B2WHB5_9PSEU|nr:extracellular solute-binding protein [Solihabitans fulvus]KAA2250130.1 extracellular solute-binding protein [Solihabitans fulvus]